MYCLLIAICIFYFSQDLSSLISVFCIVRIYYLWMVKDKIAGKLSSCHHSIKAGSYHLEFTINYNINPHILNAIL